MKLTARVREKYSLYEQAVQSPEIHAKWFGDIYRELRGKKAQRLREDFCGTFSISTEWVKLDPKNQALALDLDPEPLAYGKAVHHAALQPEQKKRVSVLRQNVISRTAPVDLAIACNFSFCTFHDRPTLVEYFKQVRKSLKPDGVFMLDLVGGAGMIFPMQEKKIIREGRKEKAIYVWDQQEFDPLTCMGHWAIHFKVKKGGRKIPEAFHYHWRLWSIPEVRDALKDAGFTHDCVYWETEHKGKGTGEYLRTEQGDNAYSWIAYVVASNRKFKAPASPKRKKAKAKSRSR